MELDDMKLAWQTLDRRLELQNALDLHRFKEGRLDKARQRLRPMVWGLRAQLLFGIAMIVFGALIWPRHWHEPIVLFSGMAMHLYGIGVIIVSGKTLWMIHNVDYAAPVLAIQQQLASVRRFHLQGSLWLGNAWWFLWMPAIVVAWSWANVPAELIDRAMPMFIGGTIVGVVGLGLFIAFDRWIKTRPDWAKRLHYNVSPNLEKVQGFLDEIARFEKI